MRKQEERVSFPILWSQGVFSREEPLHPADRQTRATRLYTGCLRGRGRGLGCRAAEQQRGGCCCCSCCCCSCCSCCCLLLLPQLSATLGPAPHTTRARIDFVCWALRSAPLTAVVVFSLLRHATPRQAPPPVQRRALSAASYHMTASSLLARGEGRAARGQRRARAYLEHVAQR